MTDEPKKPRGFAAWPKEKVIQMASKGGKAAHAKGTAHQFDSAEARAAGSKGGHATHAKMRDREKRSEDE